MAARSPAADPAVRAWVATLRAGGVAAWQPTGNLGRPEHADADAPAFLPGAQQLELLRRINLRARDRGLPVNPDLADRVLQVGHPGRGPGDLPLLGAPSRPFGPPPVDPTTLSAALLAPIAAGLVARALLRFGAAGEASEPQAGPTWPLVERTRAGDLVAGDPWLRAPLAPGRPLVGRRLRRRRGYLLAGDLGLLALHTWCLRCLDGEPLDLERWLHRRVAETRVPAAVDVVAGAARLRERVGTRRTFVVTRPDAAPSALFGGSVGAPVLDLGAVDVVRRVSLRLRSLVPDPVRRELVVERLVPALRNPPRVTGASSTPSHVLPERLTARVLSVLEQRAAQAATELRRIGYPVLGSLDDLAPRAETLARPAPSDDDALRRLIDLLLDGPLAAEEAS